MADPKRVDSGGGIGAIADLLKLFGGTQQTTQNTGDVSGLQQLQGELQNQDFSGLLQSIFAGAAGQTPGLQARMSNAVGARTGNNGALNAALQKLLQDTAIKAQGQIVQQQQQNQQLRGQVAGNIANATGGSKVQSGTNMGKAATGLGALQAIGQLTKGDNLKRGKDLLGGLFSSGDTAGAVGSTAGDLAGGFDLGNFSIGGDIGSSAGSAFGDVGYGEAVAGLGDLFSVGDYGDAASSIGGSYDFSGAGDAGSAAADTAGSADSSWLGAAWEGISDFFSFADGGMVGRDGKKSVYNEKIDRAEAESVGGEDKERERKDNEESKELLKKLNASRNPKTGKGLDSYDKSSSMVDKKTGIRFADGGEVGVRSGGGRRSSAPQYTPDNILQSLASQGLTGLTPARSNPAGGMSRGAPELSDGIGDEESSGFSLGIGSQTPAHQAQTQSVVNAFMQSLVTQNPFTFAKAAFSNDFGKQAQMNALNQAPDPLTALFAYQSFMDPAAISGIGSDNLAAAANAQATNQGIDPMDALMGLTDAFGTMGGEAAGIGASESEGFGGSQGNAGEGDAGDDGGSGGSTGGAGEGGSGDSAGAGSGGEWANGGKIKGPGTGTSDSIPAMVSKGEYIIPADVVKQLGVNFFDDLRQNFHSFTQPGA